MATFEPLDVEIYFCESAAFVADRGQLDAHFATAPSFVRPPRLLAIDVSGAARVEPPRFAGSFVAATLARNPLVI
jgi:hypothetical protein